MCNFCHNYLVFFLPIIDKVLTNILCVFDLKSTKEKVPKVALGAKSINFVCDDVQVTFKI